MMKHRAATLIFAVFITAACSRTTASHSAGTSITTRKPDRVITAQASSNSRNPTQKPTVTGSTNFRFLTLQMTDQVNGWGMAQKSGKTSGLFLIRTTDAGLQWLNVSPWGSSSSPANGATAFLNKDTAWVAVPDPALNLSAQGITLYHTNDGGKSWHNLHVKTGFPNATAVFPVSFSFADTTHGWLMVQSERSISSSQGELLTTVDGGQTWTVIANTYGSGGEPGSLPFAGDIRFIDPTTGWLTGGRVSSHGNLLYVTHDGGRTWQKVHVTVPQGRTQTSMTLTPPTFSGARGILPVQFHGRGAATYLYIAQNGGSTWHYTQPVQSTFIDIIATNNVVALGGETLYHTTDEGNTWTFTEASGDLPVLLSQEAANMDGITFSDAMDGWIYGTKPTHSSIAGLTAPETPFLVETTDGGHTWSRLDTVVLSQR